MLCKKDINAFIPVFRDLYFDNNRRTRERIVNSSQSRGGHHAAPSLGVLIVSTAKKRGGYRGWINQPVMVSSRISLLWGFVSRLTVIMAITAIMKP
jgi:hypothetical protein